MLSSASVTSGMMRSDAIMHDIIATLQPNVVARTLDTPQQTHKS